MIFEIRLCKLTLYIKEITNQFVCGVQTKNDSLRRLHYS